MKTYLQDNQAEAFKKIAEAIGYHCVNGMAEGVRVYWLDKCRVEEFNPLTNAEQWIECLFWYRAKLYCLAIDDFMASTSLTCATSSREALLIAILEVVDEH